MLAPDTLVLEGRFRVLRPLGEGGMGEVYLGEQVSLGRKVAIKVLHHDLHSQPGMAERFKREARLLSAVEHPAVVRIVDYGESGDAACLVMEFVEGESLFDVLRTGPMQPARALPLLHQLAEGLAAIHDKGIIHRDLKPENVFITPGARGEQARLLDFGIARLVEPDAASNLSQVGVVLGTPEYLSPEQAVGIKVDTRADLYSFGVLMYRVLSGRLPFDGPSPRQYLAQHASAAPLPLDRAAPSLSRYIGLLALVMRLLEKNPSKRMQNAHELTDSLTAAMQSLVPWTPVRGTPAYTAPAMPAMSSGGAAFAGDAVASGTAAFAGGAPVPSSGTAAFAGVAEPIPSSGNPVVGRSGTAAFGSTPRHSGSLGVVTGGAPVVKPQNLTVMLTDIQGFTERTSRQTHEENARMLETHDRLLLPLVKEHEGRLVQKRGDALLVAFRSPTAGVLCGMAMQDRLWRHNRAVPAGEQLHVRVCLHAGEVLIASDTLLGEPMEVVEAVEHVAAADEVTFTEAVNLARNRVEALAEPCGTIPLPGREEQLQLYRCVRASEGAPYGDRFAPESTLGEKLAAVVDRVKSALSGLKPSGAPKTWKGRLSPVMDLGQAALTGLRGQPKRLAVVAGAVVLLGAGTAWVVHTNDPAVQARAFLKEGKLEEAQQQLDRTPEAERNTGPLRRLRAAVLHGQGKHSAEYKQLSALDEKGRAEVEDWVLEGLAEDYGKPERTDDPSKVLRSLPTDRVRSHFEDLAKETFSLRQWGAVRWLENIQSAEKVDLVSAYASALEAKDCDVRALAAKRLGALGDAKVIPALTRVTEQPREKKFLKSGNCGHDEARDAIQKLTKKSE